MEFLLLTIGSVSNSDHQVPGKEQYVCHQYPSGYNVFSSISDLTRTYFVSAVSRLYDHNNLYSFSEVQFPC